MDFQGIVPRRSPEIYRRRLPCRDVVGDLHGVGSHGHTRNKHSGSIESPGEPRLKFAAVCSTKCEQDLRCGSRPLRGSVGRTVHAYIGAAALKPGRWRGLFFRRRRSRDDKALRMEAFLRSSGNTSIAQCATPRFLVSQGGRSGVRRGSRGAKGPALRQAVEPSYGPDSPQARAVRRE